MKAGAALVLTADPGEAGRRAAGVARASLGDSPPAFGILFASAHFHESAEALLAAVIEQTGPLPLIGCVAESVVGGAREVESEPAVSLWLAADVGPAETFDMEFVRTASGGAYGGYRFEPGRKPAGALLFTCNGRGSRMFAEPDHDARLLASMLGDIPMAGFFCGGELGPVAGQNYLHTFTASIALFPGAAG